MQRKPSIPLFATLLLLALAGLGYVGWKDARHTETKSWTPPVMPTAVDSTETPTPGWWRGLPSRPVFPTMPGRLVIAATVIGTSSKKTFTPAKIITGTPFTGTTNQKETATP